MMLGVLSPPCSRPVAGTGCWPLTLQVTAVRPPTDARSHDHTARAYVCTCLLPAACLLKTGNVINNYTSFFFSLGNVAAVTIGEQMWKVDKLNARSALFLSLSLFACIFVLLALSGDINIVLHFLHLLTHVLRRSQILLMYN